HIYFGLSVSLLMASDYVPLFFLPVFFIYAVYKKRSVKWWKHFIISFIPLMIFGLFWMPIFLIQIKNYQRVLQNLPLWRGVVGGVSMRQITIFWMKLILGRISFNKYLYYPLILITSVIYLVLLIKSFNRKNLFFVLWFFVPLILGISSSFIFPAFNYFRFLYVVPGFIVLLVRGSKNSKYGNLLLFMIMIINILGLSIYYFDKDQHREDWRSAVREVEARASVESSAIVFNYYLIPAGFRWYDEGYKSVYALSDESKLQNILSNYDSLYYFDYLEDIYDPDNLLKKKIVEDGFKEIEIFDYRGIGQIRYYIR
ncbi:hypothetical protein JXA63_04800, partial [Candidatus Woesebacteria bacterium]|nr:hypothetical protein [Candidatus Woesebacteria bacterium]